MKHRKKKKEKLRRLGSVMLAACMALSVLPAAYADTGAAAAQASAAAGSDITGHWAESELKTFIDKGYLKGSGDGYRPDGVITRAQFAALSNRIMNYSAQAADMSGFNDIKADAWYRADMSRAVAAGYMTGTAAGSLSPEAQVTREQAFVMLARMLKLDGVSGSEADSVLSAYKDAELAASWSRESTAALISAGYVSGDSSGRLNPSKALTRAECVTLLARVLKAADGDKAKDEAKTPDQTKGSSTSGGGRGHSGGGSGSSDKDKSSLNDGVWYGTATEGYRFATEGPSVLKVTVEKGVIKDVATVKFADDSGEFRGRAESLFIKVEGKSDVGFARNQLEKRSGECYDGVSGATFSGMAYITAMENALSRSRAGGAQEVAWIEPAGKPDIVYLNEAIDMSGIALNVYLNSDPDTAVSVKGSEAEKYGITASLSDGSKLYDGRVITSENIDSNKTLGIVFREASSRSAAYVNIYTGVRTVKREATHIKVIYENQSEEIINTVKGEFRYDLTPVSGVVSMELYENDLKLCDAVHYAASNSWYFDVSGIDPGEGCSWAVTSYRVDVGELKDDSAIKSFTISGTDGLSYKAGEKLDMSAVTVKAVTENKNTLNISWADAVKRGFTSDPADGYEFTAGDVGTRIVTVAAPGAGSQTFEIAVTAEPAAEAGIPDVIRLMYGVDTVVEITGLSTEWNEGYLTKTGILLPAKYNGADRSGFSVIAYDAAGNELAAALTRFTKVIFAVSISDYQYNLTAGYKYEEKVISQIPARVDMYMAGQEEGDVLASIVITAEEIAGVKEFGTPVVKWADIKDLIPADWSADTFIIKAYNADGDELRQTSFKKGTTLYVTFTDFITDTGAAGSIRIGMRSL